MLRRFALGSCAALAACSSLSATPQAADTAVGAEIGAEIRVDVAIDFGPTGRAPLGAEVLLPAGSTPIDAARALTEVEQDWLCCSDDDVWSIGGLDPDARLDRYWFWRVDGVPGPVAPSAHVLSSGERIEWVYDELRPELCPDPSRPEEPAGRIVSLVPAATEIAIAVGGGDQLVAITHLCPQPDGPGGPGGPGGRDLPRVLSTSIDSERWSMAEIDRAVREASSRRESLYAIDSARIAELAPTLILTQGLCPVCAVTPETIEPALRRHSDTCPPLLTLSPRSLADVALNIRQVGEALDRLGAGRVAARLFERRLEAVRALPLPGPRPRVAVIEWFEPLWVSGEWIAEMVEVAGGEPLLARDSSRRIEWSDLVASDPDVIVLAACSMSVERAGRELHFLTERAEWRELEAVAAGRVFLLDGERFVSTPGPGLAEGVEHLARILRDPDGAIASDERAWRRVRP